MTDQITIRGARLHNLKNLTLSIPKNRLVVLTGLSGSGKSTLAFDILNKEGQRQYIESLGLIAFGLAKPPVESITGLSPSISVDQRLTNHSPRSTLGTATVSIPSPRLRDARAVRRPPAQPPRRPRQHLHLARPALLLEARPLVEPTCAASPGTVRLYPAASRGGWASCQRQSA
jgi:excinuclease UvrABC ATPase subunit